MDSEIGRIAFRVVGRVQGVGFRWWTRRAARELGVAGWVRNEGDGSVVVHAIGPASALERLEAALRSGPMGARVDQLESIVPLELHDEAEFRIES
jgi:acylphosphatase